MAFVVSAPLMSAVASAPMGPMGHMAMPTVPLFMEGDVSVHKAVHNTDEILGDNTRKISGDFSGMMSGEEDCGPENSLAKCLRLFHCSTSFSQPVLSQQEEVAFYQHDLWNLLQSKELGSQIPTVDLPPPRDL